MEQSGATADDIADWERVSIKGLYKPGYELLLKKLSDVNGALMLGQWALASPVDLECNSAHGDEIFVEDVLPIYRIARLTLAFHHLGPEFKPAVDQEGLIDTLCSIAGIPSVAATLAPIFQNNVLPLHPLKPIVQSITPPEVDEIPSRLYDYRRYAISMIEKFQVSHRKYLHSLLPPARLAKLFLENSRDEELFSGLSGFREAILDQDDIFQVEPDLTIFRDHITFNGRRMRDRAFAFGDNILHLLFTEACRSIVRPSRRMRRPDDLIAMFSERLRAASESCNFDDTPLGKALEYERTLELSSEWDELRKLWPETSVSVTQFWAYLRRELGCLGERTLKSRLYERPLFL